MAENATLPHGPLVLGSIGWTQQGPATSRTLRTAYVHLILNHTYGSQCSASGASGPVSNMPGSGRPIPRSPPGRSP